MMIFGEVRPGTPRWFVAVVLPIIEALGSYGRTHKNPCAIAGWDLYSASGVIHWVLLGLSDYGSRIEQDRTRSQHSNSTGHSQQILLHCNSPRKVFSETSFRRAFSTLQVRASSRVNSDRSLMSRSCGPWTHTR